MGSKLRWLSILCVNAVLMNIILGLAVAALILHHTLPFPVINGGLLCLAYFIFTRVRAKVVPPSFASIRP